MHERLATPGTAVLSISGLFSEGEARRLVQERFGRLRGRSTPSADRLALPRQTSERFTASVDPRAKAPLAFYAWPLPKTPEALRTTFAVISQILTDSPRLEASGASGRPDIDDVRAWLLPVAGPTALAVELRVNPRSNVDKARSQLERELERLGNTGPSEAELAKARAKLASELESELDLAISRAPALGRSELETGDATSILRAGQRYARVSSFDVRQAVRNYSTETRRTSVEIYPPGWPQDLPPTVVRREHIVKAGENLIQIAKRYHSSVDAIAAANRIRSHRFIFPGQALIIPIKTADLERAKKRSYTVKAGDTLTGIAARHGVTTRALAEANGRRRNRPIRTGETLTIPEAPRKQTSSAGTKLELRQHRVKRGDSLLGLARRYGVSAADIAAANRRKANQPILAGEVLLIPNAGKAAPKNEKVRRGSSP
jgi:LysM repeat protein